MDLIKIRFGGPCVEKEGREVLKEVLAGIKSCCLPCLACLLEEQGPRHFTSFPTTLNYKWKRR